MDIKAILKTAGVNEELIEGLANTFGAEIAKEFVKKSQYNKKVQELDNVNEKLVDLEALKDKPNEFEEKYNTLKSEYDSYKNGIELEKGRATKVGLIKSNLQKAGYTDDKIVKLMVKAFDVDKMEVENNAIKGWDELSKGVLEEYADFKTTYSTSGQQGGNPPANGGATIGGTLASAIEDFYK